MQGFITVSTVKLLILRISVTSCFFLGNTLLIMTNLNDVSVLSLFILHSVPHFISRCSAGACWEGSHDSFTGCMCRGSKVSVRKCETAEMAAGVC